MTDLAMNNGYRLESMQSSGMEQVGSYLKVQPAGWYEIRDHRSL